MTDSTPVSGSSRGMAFLGMLITFFGGYFLGVFTTGGHPGADAAKEAREADRTYIALGTSPADGPHTAPVTVVEFADFQCGHCARAAQLRRRVRSEFQDKVRWVFKPYPLNSSPGSTSLLTAKASLAAASQGKFWEYHDLIFGHEGRPTRQVLLAFARDLGLDVERFSAALDDPALEKRITDDQATGRASGVQGTPTFFVNGRKLVGYTPFAQLEEILRQELALAGQLLREGTPREQLYEALSRKNKGADAPGDTEGTPSPASDAPKPAADTAAPSPSRAG